MNFEDVKAVIVETVNCAEDSVVLDADLKEDLSIDSLDAVELNMALEEKFGITISDDDLTTFVTVKDIVDYVDKKVA
jgi:acyl carrier protein